MRGCVEKPSSSLITSMSAHSSALAALAAQSGLGRLMRRNVLLCHARTVKRSVGNGVAFGSVLLVRTETPAKAVAARQARALANASRPIVRACGMVVVSEILVWSAAL